MSRLLPIPMDSGAQQPYAVYTADRLKSLLAEKDAQIQEQRKQAEAYRQRIRELSQQVKNQQLLRAELLGTKLRLSKITSSSQVTLQSPEKVKNSIRLTLE